MGKIRNLISPADNYDKDFLESVLSRFESLPIIDGKVGYAAEKNCFLLELNLSDSVKIKAIIPSGRTDYVSFALFEDNDMKIANHLTLDRLVTATENFYADK